MSSYKVGLLRWPDKPSLSPAMHNAAFRQLDLDWTYVSLPIPPESLSQTISSLKTNTFIGANVTIPHKEAALPMMDQLSPVAQSIGAINTILVQQDGTLFGDNTDAKGFITDLREHGFDPKNKSVAILGAGGSAKAVIYGLRESGCHNIAVFNRSPKMILGITTQPLTPESISTMRQYDLLVNCTPVSLEIPFSPNQTVYDLVSVPVETEFLKRAKSAGAKTISGIGMLLHQGALSFELWTGQKAPLDTMREAIQIRQC